MSVKKYCMHCGVVAGITLVYFIGGIPFFFISGKSEEYIEKQLNRYKGISIDYLVSYNEGRIQGEYKWRKEEGQHKFEGAIYLPQMDYEIATLQGVIEDGKMSIYVGNLFQPVYQKNIPEFERILNWKVVGNSIVHPEKSGKIQWTEIEGVPMLGYQFEGSDSQKIKGEDVVITYTFILDGWGNIRKINGQILMKEGEVFRFEGIITPMI